MSGTSLFCLFFSVLLVVCVFAAGCSDESPAEPVTPAHPDAKYGEGDIIATPSSSASSTLYFIMKYDAGTDQYTRAIIEKYPDGSWGFRPSDRTEKSLRADVEKIYTVKVGHIAVSIVPVITPTLLTETTQAGSGDRPSISGISPDSATRDTVVIVTIAGTNFRNGATVKLVRAGSATITATGVSVTAFDISCNFNLNGKSDGSYNLIVTNPDGQSDSVQGAFTIGEASPVIAGMYPVTGMLNEIVVLTISGRNFRNDVKVSFTKGSTELVCDKPLSMESTKISCNLDLMMTRGASAGEWTVMVLNIRDQQKGTWIKKFLVTNSTTEKN